MNTYLVENIIINSQENNYNEIVRFGIDRLRSPRRQVGWKEKYFFFLKVSFYIFKFF